MSSQLAEALALEHAPVAILLTDTLPEVATQVKEGSQGCVAAMLRAAAKGRTVAFDRQTGCCPGGEEGIGFGNAYEGFPIERLLSTGGKARVKGGWEWDMGEGERFFQSPELTERWVRDLPFREVPTEYIVCKPLAEVCEGEEVSLVFLLVNPDQLSALVTLAGFAHGARDLTISPWGAACQSLLYAWEQAEQEPPRGVMGFFDISQRERIGREYLSYTMAYRQFQEMEAHVEDSFLRTHVWEKLRARWKVMGYPPGRNGRRCDPHRRRGCTAGGALPGRGSAHLHPPHRHRGQRPPAGPGRLRHHRWLALGDPTLSGHGSLHGRPG